MEQKHWISAATLVAIGVCVLGQPTADHYCGKQWECQGTFKHLMCAFKVNTKTEKCSEISVGITNPDRLRILKLVNEFRNNLAAGEDPAFPDGAKNIRQITWDKEMERFAEVYGSQCGGKMVPELDPCAKTKDFKDGARPLWGAIETTVDDVIIGPDGWTSVIPETGVFRSFVPVDGEDRLEPNYGRFTMLAWARTYKMGCTIVACTCKPSPKPLKKLVCFLGPSGNIRWKPVFLSGEACKSCPEGTACKRKSVWNKLCAREGDPNNYNALGRATSLRFSRVLHLNLLAAGFHQVTKKYN